MNTNNLLKLVRYSIDSYDDNKYPPYSLDFLLRLEEEIVEDIIQEEFETAAGYQRMWAQEYVEQGYAS